MAKPDKTIALETQDASITTATISIKVIQVNNRQMTLSTFRQLPQARLVNHIDMMLAGTPWGRVNYHWGDQNPEHIHVLFQRDGRLYREVVDPRLSRDWPRLLQGQSAEDIAFPHDAYDLWENVVAAVTARYYADLLLGKASHETMSYHYIWSSQYDARGRALDDKAYKMCKTRSFLVGGVGFVHVEAHPHDGSSYIDEEDLGKRISHLLGEKYPFEDMESIPGRVDAAAKALGEYGKVWDEFMSPIVNLEQLFIAT
jgi:hypothetical protein